jgi:transcriptional regulator with XRE-family HTH domain
MERIRQLRKERGLSQAKLAVMADMDPATLNRLERGTGNPNLKTLERVAEALGVEVADFFPKAQRRSSPEPSLLNSLEDERRRSRFAEAVALAAERWGEAVASTDMDDSKRFGIIDAALDLSDLISGTVRGEEDWEALTYQEQREIVSTMEKLGEVAKLGLHRLQEPTEVQDQAQRVEERREQIRERTRLISA